MSRLEKNMDEMGWTLVWRNTIAWVPSLDDGEDDGIWRKYAHAVQNPQKATRNRSH